MRDVASQTYQTGAGKVDIFKFQAKAKKKKKSAFTSFTVYFGIFLMNLKPEKKMSQVILILFEEVTSI